MRSVFRESVWLSNHSKRNDAGRPLLVAPHSFRKARLATLVAAVLVPIALAGGAAIFFAEQGLATGERLARHGLWQEVHRPISRYLWLHPASPRANLIAAEALVKDDSIPLMQRITDSLRCLGRIPDTAAEGVSARIAEARVKLFLRYEPMAAEQSLAKAIAIDPESLEAHLLSWKLLELTGRAEEAEEVFWKCLALSPEEQRPLRLREWYVSQFFPLTATAELDRLMGFRGSAAEPGVAVEMRRLQRFRLAEPQEPVPHAALAELFLRENEPELAFDVLDEAAAQMPVERQTNPFILGVVVETLLELGEAEHARETFDRWPEPHVGRRYWLVRGRVLQEADNEPAEAADAYRESLLTWPGEVDWRTTNRLAGCLARAGKADAAAETRGIVQQIQEALPQETLQNLLDALASPANPEVALEMARFYRQIGRVREAEAWDAVVTESGKTTP
jgi:tetratricopeptide (TPR) repeat protein